MAVSGLGDLACLSIPDSKKEGYCEYIGGSPSIGIEEGKRLIRRGQAEARGPLRYFHYRLMVKYLMDIKGFDIDEIIAREFSPDEILAKVRQHIDRLERRSAAPNAMAGLLRQPREL